jgi:ABC-2 type transport system permease protein
MKQILHIIRREIYTNTRKKSFLIFSMLSPIVFLLPFIFMMFKSSETVGSKKVILVDENKSFLDSSFIKYDNLEYITVTELIDSAKKKYLEGDTASCFGVVYLNEDFDLLENYISPLKLYLRKEEDIKSPYMKEIESFINNRLLEKKLLMTKTNNDSIENYLNRKKIYPVVIQTGKSNADKLASVLAYIVGMLMYLMLIIFNNSLLRGVMEEKQNRLVEVFSMVVRPFNLMIGKIIGAGVLSLLQLIIWVIMSVLYLKGLNWLGTTYFNIQDSSSNTFSISFLLENYKQLPLTKILIFTPIFFIFGFLINGAITTVVAATSSAKGSSSLSIVSNFLNIGSIYIAMFSAGYPNNMIAKASIYIPLFSPIVVPALMPYDLPLHTILISLGILLISFLLLVELAGRIYRISIITYGSKISFKDIIRMIFQKGL